MSWSNLVRSMTLTQHQNPDLKLTTTFLIPVKMLKKIIGLDFILFELLIIR